VVRAAPPARGVVGGSREAVPYDVAVGYRILLDPALAPALSAAGLASAPAVLALGGDPGARRIVGPIELPVAGTSGRFRLKLYRYRGWRESKGLLGRGTLWGSAPEVAEFRALAALREKGIPAARPVVAASWTRRGRLVAHVLLTEEVPGTIDLARRLATPGDPVRDDPDTRRAVIRLAGRLLHRMHSEGIVHRDAFARNILVRVGEDEPRIWFVDCRRAGPPSWRSGTWDDLATLDSDLAGRVPRTDRLRALLAYLETGEDRRDAVSRIARRRARLS
jgi:tRNA A-37 threonylcarbamoyl transferase component Bud32